MKYFPKTKAVIMTAAHRMPGVFYFHVDSVETVTTRAYNVIKQGLVRTPPTKMVFQSPGLMLWVTTCTVTDRTRQYSNLNRI